MESKNRKIKEAKVQEIKEKMEKAQGMIIASYQGLTVEEDTELRKRLRAEGIEYKVYKNSLTLLAAKELGYEGLEGTLVGPVSIAFSYNDPTAPARILSVFAKDHSKLSLKGAIIQGEIYDEAKVKVLASIPPKEVLIAKLLGSLKSPVSNFVYLLNAIKENKENNA